MLISKRKIEPTHYMLKIDSFSLLSEARTTKIESDVFEASGHKWRLDLYPNGNDKENAGNHISLYLITCDTENLPNGWQVCVEVVFFVYDHKHHNYVTFQDFDCNGTMFHEKKIKWGFDELISLESFENSENGYLLNDSCVFGAEVFAVREYAQNDRCLTMIKPPLIMNTFTWTIDNILHLTEGVTSSEMFKVGKVEWRLAFFPKGNHENRDGTYMSLCLGINDPALLFDGRRVYAKYNLRVKNRSGNNDRDSEFDHWFDESAKWGYQSYSLLMKGCDTTKGILFNGSLMVEAEILFVGLFSNFI